MERNRGGGAGQTVGDLERGRRQGGAAERVQGEVEEQEVRAGIEQTEKETWFPGLFSENWGPLSALPTV